jgi:hypothetical protein
MENSDGDPSLFDWQAEFQYCRNKIEAWNRPADMIAIAAACGLRTNSIEKEMMISPRMVHYWKHREDFRDVVIGIGGLANNKFSPPSRPRSSVAPARSQTTPRLFPV